MITKLISIVGIDKKISQVLSDNAGIKTVKQLYDATRTENAREELAEKTGLPLSNISNWAVQAELSRMEEVSIDSMYDIMGGGIYSVEQFQKLSDKEVFEKIKSRNVYSNVNVDDIARIRKGVVRDAGKFECDNIVKELVDTSTSAPGIYSDLSGIITELGKGIANAQLELDKSSIKVQNEILENEDLYNMGLTATWYVIPETEFTLKMDYAVSEKKTSTGQLISSAVSAAPSNATFNNIFKMEKREESSVKLRFVPIPPQEKMLKRKVMPELKYADTVEDVIALLEDCGIEEYTILPAKAKEWGDAEIVVENQTPDAGKVILIGDKVPVIKLKKKTGKKE